MIEKIELYDGKYTVVLVDNGKEFKAYQEALKINNIINLKNGRRGKVIGRLENGEYILETCKGGQIIYFKGE